MTPGLEYDPTSPAVQANPYPYYASLRAHAPVHWNDRFNVWVLARHADVSALLRESRWSSNYENAGSGEADGSPPKAQDAPSLRVLMFMDSDEHAALRRVVAKTLDGRRLNNLAGAAKVLAGELLDAVRGRSAFDLIHEFSAPSSLRLLTRLLGIGDADLPLMAEAAAELSLLIAWSPSPAPLGRATRAGTALAPFLLHVVEEKRRHPGDDLISALVSEARRRKLRHSEILSTVLLLIAAGHVTSTHMIGNGVLALLQTRPVLEAWQAGVYSTSRVLDELLRFDAPVQATPRTALADMTIGGQLIRRGQTALGLLASANRDEAVFADADRLDPGRGGGGALSFGAGPHFCIGAAIARATGAVTLDTLFGRCPNLRLVDEPLQWTPTATQRGLLALNVTA